MAWLAGYYSNQQMNSAISYVRKLVFTHPPYPLLGQRGAEMNIKKCAAALSQNPEKETHLQR
jgi:hypothetical protein